jgi:hypothetical protein
LGRQVPQGLTMRTDGPDLGRRDARPTEQFGDAVCIELCQLKRCECLTMDFIGSGGLQRQQFVFQRGGKRQIGGALRPAEIRDDAIDAIEAGAGHQADIERWISHAELPGNEIVRASASARSKPRRLGRHQAEAMLDLGRLLTKLMKTRAGEHLHLRRHD